MQVIDEIAGVFIIVLQEIFDIDQEIFQVGPFLFLLLALVDTLSPCNILHLGYLLFLVEAVPLDDLADTPDRREVEVIDICMVGNPDEGLMDVGIREALHFFLRVVGSSEFFVNDFDITVEEDG